ncbi:bile acid:sodium symporter family protein [candidate division KSB1 bacterium]|nr:bile acid:sodium symporter family protein [candidate division KSB1 bacterium]
MKRILETINKLFVLWILIGGVTAYYFPAWYMPLRPFMNFFFAITMFGVGMVLNPDDFISLIKKWRVVLIGVMAQFTVMPLSAYLVGKLFVLNNDFALGLILTGSAPGAMASNVLSYLAGADVAYSVSLTTASTFLAPVMTPLLTLVLAKTMLHVSFWALFWSVCYMVLIPVLLGIAIKQILKDKVRHIVMFSPTISTLFITFICALVIAVNQKYIPNLTGWIFLSAVVLNVSGLVIGYWIGHAFKFNKLRKRALSIEIGMQNAGLGSVLALAHFNERVALPAVIFVFICIFTASILVPVWARTRAE